MLVKRQEDRPCYDRGNGYPFCVPVSTDVWYAGTHNQFVWNFNYPFYVQSERLSLYLYYEDNHLYHAVRNWTDLRRADGSLSVTIDDSWFPEPLPAQLTTKTWTYYGYYLPAGMDPAKELFNPESLYPGPFNFSVVQLAQTSNATISSHNRIPAWGIVAVVLGSLALAAITMFLLARCCFRKSLPKRVADESKPIPHTPMYAPSVSSETPMMKVSAVHVSPVTEESRISIHETGLSETTVMWMVQPHHFSSEQASQGGMRQISGQHVQHHVSEEWVTVKHAQHRPMTMTSIEGNESHAVFEELTFVK